MIAYTFQFFENKKYIMPLCIVVSLWMSLGTSFLAFIAGFQGINHDMYEAAAIDGIKAAEAVISRFAPPKRTV